MQMKMGAVLMVASTGILQQLRRIFEMLVMGTLTTALGFGIWNFVKDWQNPTTTTIAGLVIFAPFAFMFLIGTLILLWNFLYSFGHEMTVYEGGIEHKYSGKSQSWTWSELEALSYRSDKMSVNLYPVHYFEMKLRSKDKTTIHIDKIYKDYEQLAALLLQLTSEAWTKRDFKTLQAGETLTYGNISINKQGLSQAKKQIAWKEIERIDTNRINLNFSIVPQGETRRLFNIGSKTIFGTLTNTWNGHILLGLVRTILEMRRNRA